MHAPAKQRTLGRLWLEDDQWCLTCEPHVAMWAKRIFRRIPKGKQGIYTLANTPSVCRDLEWFASRFPLEIADPEELADSAQAHRDHIATLDQIIDEDYRPREFDLAVPARDYQRRAAELYLSQGGLLLADDVGLGKTATSICSLTDRRTLPAVVVCLPHLQRQWKREVERFLPSLHVHIIKKSAVYELPKRDGRGPDLLIISYHKLSSWADTLSTYVRSMILDEIQELRRGAAAQKYIGARHIAETPGVLKIGLSATPIYNFGGEIFNVINILFPGVLGSKDEFEEEWCVGLERKKRLKDPSAFGAWLRENHYILRRTRREVGRELEPLSRITYPIDSDRAPLDDIKDSAGELARTILSQEKQVDGNKMRAAEEFSSVLRQATGIAKAPHVAAFVKLLLDNGEKVVLYGWHRAVYRIWGTLLREYRPLFYSGSESPGQKEQAARAFIEGESDLMILSLRSGAGLDGLQNVARTVVFGELDWSPGVHEQCIGRVHRDGQTDPVSAYFLLAETGIDPLMAEVLGLKRDQVAGVRGEVRELVERVDNAEGLKELARKFLSR